MGFAYAFRVWLQGTIERANTWVEKSPTKKFLVSLFAVLAFGVGVFELADRFVMAPRRARDAEVSLAKLEGRYHPPEVRLSLKPEECSLVNEDHRDIRQASIVFHRYLANGDGCAGPSIISSHQVPATAVDTLRPGQPLVADFPDIAPSQMVEAREPCDRTTCFWVVECEARFFRYDLQQGFVASDYVFVGTAGTITMAEAVRRTVNVAMVPGGEAQIIEAKDDWTDPRLEAALDCAHRSKVDRKSSEIIYSAVNPEPVVRPLSHD